jgi:hypothetical protein
MGEGALAIAVIFLSRYSRRIRPSLGTLSCVGQLPLRLVGGLWLVGDLEAEVG